MRNLKNENFLIKILVIVLMKGINIEIIKKSINKAITVSFNHPTALAEYIEQKTVA